MSLKFSRALIYVLRRLVPAALRDRWTEEWQAEIAHAAAATAGRPRGTMRLLGFAAGAIADLVGLYRLPGVVVTRRESRLHGVGQDFRFAARNLANAKAFTATVVASLSIGVASVAGAYAFINTGLFPTFPGVTDQERLVEILIDRSTFEVLSMGRDERRHRRRQPDLSRVPRP